MKWSWILGKLDEEYSIDDLIDRFIQVQAMLKHNPERNEAKLNYDQHCLHSLCVAFDFDINKALENLSESDRSLVEICFRKALQIRTPTSGYQMASIFHSEHGIELKEINLNTRRLIETYREFIALILKKRFTVKDKVTKAEMLKAGYDVSLLPKDENDDIF